MGMKTSRLEAPKFKDQDNSNNNIDITMHLRNAKNILAKLKYIDNTDNTDLIFNKLTAYLNKIKNKEVVLLVVDALLKDQAILFSDHLNRVKALYLNGDSNKKLSKLNYFDLIALLESLLTEFKKMRNSLRVSAIERNFAARNLAVRAADLAKEAEQDKAIYSLGAEAAAIFMATAGAGISMSGGGKVSNKNLKSAGIKNANGDQATLDNISASDFNSLQAVKTQRYMGFGQAITSTGGIASNSLKSGGEIETSETSYLKKLVDATRDQEQKTTSSIDSMVQDMGSEIKAFNELYILLADANNVSFRGGFSSAAAGG